MKNYSIYKIKIETIIRVEQKKSHTNRSINFDKNKISAELRTSFFGKSVKKLLQNTRKMFYKNPVINIPRTFPLNQNSSQNKHVKTKE